MTAGPAPGAPCARTNVQLHRQLVRAGYPTADIDRCRRAYRLAAQLFTAQFRASHDTFLSHLVGTASVLAELRAPAPVVAAGLLHAAYTEGDFGAGRGVLTRTARAEVRAAVGEDAEALVQRYAAFHWTSDALAELHARGPALTGVDREVLLMRLANALDDHAEGAVLHAANVEERRRYLRVSGPLLVDLARRLDRPELAAWLEAAFREILGGKAVARSDGKPRPRAYLLPPRSFSRRWPLRVSLALRAARRGMRKVLTRGRSSRP